jgi:gliding motility-associated-like protein
MKKNLNSFCLFILSIVSYSFPSYAQRGKDGNVVIAAATNTIVNQYTSLTADAATGNTTITVNSTSSFSAGDLVMIIQMQGATIKGNVQDSTWGQVTNYNNSGNNEFREVLSVINGTQLSLTCGLEKSYTSAGKVQVIRVPRYNTLTVAATGSITATAWNGTTGGIVAIECVGDITVNGIIQVNGMGFRGGLKDNGSQAPQSNITLYYSTDTLNGAAKGESIAGYGTDYNTYGGSICRGAPANGGGGGDSHNAGGGGGANGGDISLWNGKGNPVAGYNAAWNLEGGTFSTKTSSGGGRGGYTFSLNDQNAATTGPSNTSWGGDYRNNTGGNGGRPIDYSTGKLFFGGGGGSGDANNGLGVNGGNGGGLIYLKGYGNMLGTGTIQANGANGGTVGGAGNDAPSGAGGGGTIILNALGTVSGVIATSTGGIGGTQNIGSAEAEGPGGGGGGGYIALSNAGITTNVAGGANGTTTSTALTEFPPNGATAGGAGKVSTVTNFSLTAISTSTICVGQSAVLTATVSGAGVPPSPVFSWWDASVGGNQLATGSSFTVSPVTTTTYYAAVCPGTFRIPSIVKVDPLPTATIAKDTTVYFGAQNVQVIFTGASGTPPYKFTYSINGGSNQTVTSAPATNKAVVSVPTDSLGTYTYSLVSVSDASTNACSHLQSGTAVIIVNPLQLSITNPKNGVEDTSNVTFTVRLNHINTTGGPVTGTLSLTGTATPGSDYTNVVSYTIPNGSDTALITIPVLNDNFIELPESVIATISNPGYGVTIVNPTDSALIIDLDYTHFSTSIYTLTNGAEGFPPTDIVYTIKLDSNKINETGSPIAGTLSYSGTAASGLDYTAVTTYTISNGEDSVNITVPVLNDSLAEPTETVIAIITSTGLGSIGIHDSASATILNFSPTANNDTGITNEDTPIVINNITSNDTPVGFINKRTIDLDTLTPGIQDTIKTATGVWKVDTSTGNVTYTPKLNYNGIAVIYYTVKDDSGAVSNTASISITVTPVNDTLVVSNDSATTLKNILITGNIITLGDYDPDSTILVVDTIPVKAPSHGTFIIDSAGAYRYTPDSKYVGKDTIVLQVCDSGIPLPPTCKNDTLFVKVTPVTDTLHINLPKDSIINICDTTLIGVPADNVHLCGSNVNGTSTIVGSCIKYVPHANYVGEDSTCYIACKDGQCDTTIVIYRVLPKTDTIRATTPKDSTLTLCGNAFIGTTADSIKVLDGGKHGNSLPVAPLKICVNYTPNSGYVGKDTTSYIACNDGLCDTTFVIISVKPKSDTIPVAIRQDSTVTICGNTFIGATADSVKVITKNDKYGTSKVISNNCITYTPKNKYVGLDTVTYVACNSGLCDTTTVLFTVTPKKDTLHINLPKDSVINICDTTLIGVPADNVHLCGSNVNGISTIVGSCIKYVPHANYVGKDSTCYIACKDGQCDTTIVIYRVLPKTDTIKATISKDSTLTLCGNSFIGTTADSVKVLDDGKHGISLPVAPLKICVKYTPTSGYVGKDTASYIACNDGLCNTTFVIITVKPKRDTIPVTIRQDSTVTLCGNIFIGATADSVKVIPKNDSTSKVISNNCITYTPKNKYVGLDTATYVACNDGLCDTTVVTFTITPKTDTIHLTVREDNSITICDTTFIGVTADNVQIYKQSSNGLSTPLGKCITYLPNSNYNGLDTARYVACKDGQCDTTIVIFKVTPINHPPKAFNDTITTNEDTPVTINVTANDIDVDGNGTINVKTVDLDTLTPGIQDSIKTATGVWKVDTSTGNVTYTPKLNYNGIAVIYYTVKDDSAALSNTAMITVTVTPVNDKPVVSNKFDTTNVNIGTYNYNLIQAGDGDTADVGTIITVNTAPLVPPSQGTFTISPTGVYSYTPAANYTGKDSVQLQICDNGYPLPPQCVTAFIYFNVLPCDINNPLLDCDGDGVPNGQDTDPTDPCKFNIANVTLPPSAAWNVIDCDGDGVPNGVEVAHGTNPSDICSYDTIPTLPISPVWDTLDCDGDGVINNLEVVSHTNPQDPCSYNPAYITHPQKGAWLTKDCDGDGLTNQEELVDGTDPLKKDTDGDGVPDGKEVADKTNPNDICSYNPSDVTLPVSPAWDSLDCDGDGVINITELQDHTDPKNACDLNKAHITVTRTKYCGPEIPEGFSPNGDGINDVFVIKGLDDYPNNSITIYNRWGDEVYKAKPYTNQWNGELNIKSLNIGNDNLPSGVYFYIFDLGDGSKVIKGNIYLNK